MAHRIKYSIRKQPLMFQGLSDTKINCFETPYHGSCCGVFFSTTQRQPVFLSFLWIERLFTKEKPALMTIKVIPIKIIISVCTQANYLMSIIWLIFAEVAVVNQCWYSPWPVPCTAAVSPSASYPCVDAPAPLYKYPARTISRTMEQRW